MAEIKCIYRINTYAGDSLVKSQLYGEDADGNRRPLMQKYEGYTAILTVTPKGFKLTTGNSGEVLRQGTLTDVFEINDSLLLNPDPLLICDEIKGVEMAYTTYRNKYAVGRVERSHRAKYYAYAVEGTDGTGIGIEQSTEGETYYIFSLYYDGFFRDQDKSKKVVDAIESTLWASWRANVSATNMAKYIKHPFIKVYASRDGYRFDQAKQLAVDALERQSSVSEQLAVNEHLTREGEEVTS